MNKKLVILHVMESLFAKGGTPRKLLSLVENGDKEKFLHIFLLFNNHADNLSDDVRRAGGIVEEVSRLRNYDIRFLFDIIGMVRKHKVAIINTHFARSDIYGMVAGLLCGTPVIKSVHGIPWNDSLLLIHLERLLARFRYLTTYNSHASLDSERRRSHVKKATVIHNGVIPREGLLNQREREAFRRDMSIPEGKFVIGHIGGIVDWRNHNVILDAIHILIEQGVNVRFVIAGDGPERVNLEKQVDRLGIREHVTLLGYRDDIAKLLSIFDVYVNMATEEGFGIAVVEAMFAEVPVVLANAGAHPELIVDDESGILISEGSSDELADALTRLAEDSSLRQRLGEGGKKRANEKFTISRFVRDFENLYLECVRNTRRK